ncbi:cupin domain-containing protein [Streptomyces glaucosporus]|uniref:Cupin domain-containing protein n=1 Tax=Streptomyces glaucosporus TaxID=284044 RepID=A0ABN3IJJ4_9ACTN
MDAPRDPDPAPDTSAAATPPAAAELGLEPHPEGGWYRRLWAAAEQVTTARGRRAAATAVHYLLAPGEESRPHRVASDELWLWHGGGPLALAHAPEPDGARPVTTVLGAGRGLARTWWALVPAGHWQTARPAGPEPALVTCVVAPGFDWADLTLLGE